MRIRMGHRAVVASVSVSAALAAGCGGTSGSAAKAPPNVTNGVVSMTLDGPVSSYDPTQASTFQDSVALAALYDTLVAFDPSGKLVPGLSDTWKSTPKTATFHLRGGVTCSDGTALTGAMVAASLNRLFDPATKAPLVRQAIGPGNSAKATSTADSVTITMAKAWSDLVPGMTGPFAGIVCPSGMKDPSSLRTKSAGTGAFVSESQVTGSSYTLTRRPQYAWGPAYAAQTAGEPPKKLVLKVVDDENTRANLTSTGELQIPSFTSNAWDRFKSTGGITVRTSPQSDTMLVFNETVGHPTADRGVRLAIAQALDRSVLNKVQSFGSGELISSLGRPSYECFDSGSNALVPKYDAAAAAKALKGVKLQVIGTNILAAARPTTRSCPRCRRLAPPRRSARWTTRRGCRTCSAARTTGTSRSSCTATGCRASCRSGSSSCTTRRRRASTSARRTTRRRRGPTTRPRPARPKRSAPR
ncbi:ABC transporter substrate-binding protein [Actinomadura luteofluorescens]|uniref:ABC transporter substrate-binding protein n=1 Tax=Actinomadura luteofluorescens TaxID=46163 RepID=UPI00363F7B17